MAYLRLRTGNVRLPYQALHYEEVKRQWVGNHCIASGFEPGTLGKLESKKS
ncbi:hypothetical protein GCM10011533_20310 [Streptosporangium jomthongense]|nr:hypothetical protein GCM10011533_20310 [Streptosporangium jomthongense]